MSEFWQVRKQQGSLPQTDLSGLSDVRVPYSGQAFHFGWLERDREKKVRKLWVKEGNVKKDYYDRGAREAEGQGTREKQKRKKKQVRAEEDRKSRRNKRTGDAREPEKERILCDMKHKQTKQTAQQTKTSLLWPEADTQTKSTKAKKKKKIHKYEP